MNINTGSQLLLNSTAVKGLFTVSDLKQCTDISHFDIVNTDGTPIQTADELYSLLGLDSAADGALRFDTDRIKSENLSTRILNFSFAIKAHMGKDVYPSAVKAVTVTVKVIDCSLFPPTAVSQGLNLIYNVTRSAEVMVTDLLMLFLARNPICKIENYLLKAQNSIDS